MYDQSIALQNCKQWCMTKVLYYKSKQSIVLQK